MYTATIPTPPGPFTIVASDEAVLASGWTDDPERLRAMIGARAAPGRRADAKRDLGPFTQAVAGVRRRRPDGDRRDPRQRRLDAVPRARVGASCALIPAGAPETYGQLAARCESPSAVRAAGTACGRNPAALFVPCHRIVRTGGGLGGFGYGLPSSAGCSTTSRAPPRSPEGVDPRARCPLDEFVRCAA